MKRESLQALAACWILLGTTPAVCAASAPSPPFARSLSHGDCDLVLRSASLKEATLFKVNVYWIGLYLETANTPPDSIIDSKQVKAFVFHFLRDVKSDKLQSAWIQDLTAACVENCAPVIAQGRVLARKMPDIHSSQKIAYILLPDRVEVLLDGVSMGTLVGESSTRAIQATFLGPQAPLKLRQDLVGFRER